MSVMMDPIIIAGKQTPAGRGRAHTGNYGAGCARAAGHFVQAVKRYNSCMACLAAAHDKQGHMTTTHV